MQWGARLPTTVHRTDRVCCATLSPRAPPAEAPGTGGKERNPNVGVLSKARVATLLPIRNMNRALSFYTQKLGAKLVYRGEGSMKNSWAWIHLGNQDFWFVTPDRREARKLSYTTFLVRNIEFVVGGLKRKGVKFARPEKMSRKSKVKGSITYEEYGASAFFKDSEGNLLMVWQNNPPM